MPNAARVALVIALLLALPARARAQGERASPQPDLHIELGATPLLVSGWTPATAIGISPYFTLRSPHTSLWIEPRAIAAPLGDRRSAAVTFGASACRHIGQLFLCSLLQVGKLSPSLSAGLLPGGEASWTAASGARGGGDWPISRRLHGRAFFELHHLFDRPRTFVSDGAPWYPPRIAVTLGAGLLVPVYL